MRFSSSACPAHVEVAREGVHSRARDPAHPEDGFRLCSRARRIFPNGQSDIGGQGGRLQARLSPPLCFVPPAGARLWSFEKNSRPRPLTATGAGVMQSVEAVVGASAGGGGRLQCDFRLLSPGCAGTLVATSVCRVWDPRSRQSRMVALVRVGCWLEVAVSDRGVRWDRCSAHRRASARTYALSSAVPNPAARLCCDETVEIVSRARVGSSGAVFCIRSLTGIMDGP